MQITPLILTLNEAPNIGRTVGRLTWATEVVVVDSLSDDATRSILEGIPNVTVVEREFDQHANQWNFGIAQCRSEWVLGLDADHLLSDQLIAELSGLNPQQGVSAYFARFDYCVFGRPIRGSLYPPRAVLFRRDRCRFEQDGHTQELRVDGEIRRLEGKILHDDRKPLRRWLADQAKYADLEAIHLLGKSPAELSFPDRLRRKVILAPPLVFLYSLLGKGVILDGWPGWYYTVQRTVAELLLSLRLIEAKLAGSQTSNPSR